jgi:hypothetical protein
MERAKEKTVQTIKDDPTARLSTQNPLKGVMNLACMFALQNTPT